LSVTFHTIWPFALIRLAVGKCVVAALKILEVAKEFQFATGKVDIVNAHVKGVQIKATVQRIRNSGIDAVCVRDVILDSSRTSSALAARMRISRSAKLVRMLVARALKNSQLSGCS
jgi:hypothetical protein